MQQLLDRLCYLGEQVGGMAKDPIIPTISGFREVSRGAMAIGSLPGYSQADGDYAIIGGLSLQDLDHLQDRLILIESGTLSDTAADVRGDLGG